MDPSQQAFKSAMAAFKKTINDNKLHQDILRTTTIEGVWTEAKNIQARQEAKNRIRNMGKIRRFLDKIAAYASTVDTFVQVKPEIMALIWGPIRILLVWTENIAKLADAIFEAMEKIGDALPQFIDAAKIFSDNEKLKQVLALFYGDILDFYAIMLAFFRLSRKSPAT